MQTVATLLVLEIQLVGGQRGRHAGPLHREIHGPEHEVPGMHIVVYFATAKKRGDGISGAAVANKGRGGGKGAFFINKTPQNMSSAVLSFALLSAGVAFACASPARSRAALVTLNTEKPVGACDCAFLSWASP